MSEETHILITGGTGFIGKRLINEILSKNETVVLNLLVEPKFAELAQAFVAKTRLSYPKGQLKIFIGNITLSDLGLDSRSYNHLIESVDSVFHLAAIYDLAVSRRIAELINIKGTENILSFVENSAKKATLLYFSTCYVSGRRTGRILETELSHSEGFKNHYEETKFIAEKRVRSSMEKGMPALIIRPGIVCGDSETGITEKFDGLYFSFRLLWKLRWLPAPIPLPGRLRANMNLVPVDYLTKTCAHLFTQRHLLAGQTFQITDPSPLQSHELFEWVHNRIFNRYSGIVSPSIILKALLSFSFLRKELQVPKETAEYLNHHCIYATTNTLKALENTTIRCPSLIEYIPKLYAYWLENDPMVSGPRSLPASHRSGQSV